MLFALFGLLALLFAAKVMKDRAVAPPPLPIATPPTLPPTGPSDFSAPGAPMGEPIAPPTQTHTNESLHEAQELEKRRMGIKKILPPKPTRRYEIRTENGVIMTGEAAPVALPGKSPALLGEPSSGTKKTAEQ